MLEEVQPFGGFRNEKSKYKVVGAPFEFTQSYREGTKWAPYEVRRASAFIEFRSELGGIDVDEIGFDDLGNVVPVPGDLRTSLERLEKVVNAVDGVPVLIGGEHSVTYAALRAVKPDCVLVFDAHLDMRDEYMDNKFTHATWLRRAIEDVGVRAHVVGARAYVGEEVEFAKDVGVSFEKKAGVLTFDFVNSCRELYISVDVDYFDPSVAPGVANPEPGGASFDEFLRTLSSVVYKSGVVGLDVVEIAPPYDDGTTAVLGARIIVEIVGALER